MASTKLYEIEVTRTYTVSDTICVESTNSFEAEEAAIAISNDKDCTGRLALCNVEVDIYSEQVVDD